MIKEMQQPPQVFQHLFKTKQALVACKTPSVSLILLQTPREILLIFKIKESAIFKLWTCYQMLNRIKTVVRRRQPKCRQSGRRRAAGRNWRMVRHLYHNCECQLHSRAKYRRSEDEMKNKMDHIQYQDKYLAFTFHPGERIEPLSNSIDIELFDDYKFNRK